MALLSICDLYLRQMNRCVFFACVFLSFIISLAVSHGVIIVRRKSRISGPAFGFWPASLPPPCVLFMFNCCGGYGKFLKYLGYLAFSRPLPFNLEKLTIFLHWFLTCGALSDILERDWKLWSVSNFSGHLDPAVKIWSMGALSIFICTFLLFATMTQLRSLFLEETPSYKAPFFFVVLVLSVAYCLSVYFPLSQPPFSKGLNRSISFSVLSATLQMNCPSQNNWVYVLAFELFLLNNQSK